MCLINASPANAQFLRNFQGNVGTSVTAYGLTPGESYVINWDDYLTILNKGTVPDSGEVSFTIPRATGGTHYVYVFSPVGDTQAEILALFTVLPALTFTPSSGPAGTKVEVKGSGFGRYEEDIILTYGGTSQVASGISTGVDGTFTTSFTVPVSTSGKHPLDASGPATTPGQIAASFSVTPSIGLSSQSGTGGSIISVSGRGFDSRESGITVTFDGKQVLSGITADNSGSWSGEFTVPAANNGSHIVAAYGNVNTIKEGTRVNFTVSGSAGITTPVILPAPVIKSPANGSRQGFLGKTRLDFEWSAVTGSSITYDLQVSDSSNFDPLLINKTKLVSAAYKLAESEALPEGKFYFRVRAVDASGNPGKWTDPAAVEIGVDTVMLIFCTIGAAVIVALIIFGVFRLFRKKK